MSSLAKYYNTDLTVIPAVRTKVLAQLLKWYSTMCAIYQKSNRGTHNRIIYQTLAHMVFGIEVLC